MDVPMQTLYSVIVERIPDRLRSSTALTQFFNELYPNQVHSASVCMDISDLDTLYASCQRSADR